MCTVVALVVWNGALYWSNSSPPRPGPVPPLEKSTMKPKKVTETIKQIANITARTFSVFFKETKWL
jgi:hypothetical protein